MPVPDSTRMSGYSFWESPFSGLLVLQDINASHRNCTFERNTGTSFKAPHGIPSSAHGARPAAIGSGTPEP
ncbi:MAG TPA: hypothetical protein VFV92_08030, partial [Candidatus Bathyarchaeia archaeon]|nr:hypothetical protein [Candidatus Bathyarchaeia archaeon]